MLILILIFFAFNQDVITNINIITQLILIMRASFFYHHILGTKSVEIVS